MRGHEAYSTILTHSPHWDLLPLQHRHLQYYHLAQQPLKVQLVAPHLSLPVTSSNSRTSLPTFFHPPPLSRADHKPKHVLQVRLAFPWLSPVGLHWGDQVDTQVIAAAHKCQFDLAREVDSIGE